MGSMGGLVSCAKRSLKWSSRRRGSRSSMAAGGVSSPIEPTAGLPVLARAASSTSSSSRRHAEGELQPAEVAGGGPARRARLHHHARARHGVALHGDEPVHLVREQHVAVLEVHHHRVAGAEDLLLLDVAEVHGAGELARGERVVLRGEQPQRPQAVPVEVRHRLVAVAGDDRGGAVARPRGRRTSPRGRR